MPSKRPNKTIIRNIFDLSVVLCGTIGLCFSIIGLWKFPNQKLLFVITLFGCLIGILIAIVDLFETKRDAYNNLFRLILSILSGIVLVLASIFLIFFTNCPLFIKGVSVFGIIFFCIAIIKGIIRILKNIKDS